MEKGNKATNKMYMLPHLKACNTITILKSILVYTKIYSNI